MIRVFTVLIFIWGVSSAKILTGNDATVTVVSEAQLYNIQEKAPIKIGDYDGDGKNDIAILTENYNGPSGFIVYSYAKKMNLLQVKNLLYVVAEDLDGDGDVEIITEDGKIFDYAGAGSSVKKF